MRRAASQHSTRRGAVVADHARDFALPDLGDFVAGLVELEEPDVPEGAVVPTVESITIELPIELTLESAAGGELKTRCGPPTQYTSTSVMPVFHQLRMRIVPHDGG